MNARKNPKGQGWNERELGALWVKTKFGSDQKYLTGQIKIPVGHPPDVPMEIIMFPNKDFQGGDNRPHWRIYIRLGKQGKQGVPKKSPRQEVEELQWTPDASEGDGSLDDVSLWED